MKEKFIALLTFTSSLRNFGTKFIRVAILVVFVWIGGLKYFHYEADGIVPFVANSPFMSFLPQNIGYLFGTFAAVQQQAFRFRFHPFMNHTEWGRQNEFTVSDSLQEEMLRILLKRFIIQCTRIARHRLDITREKESGFEIVRQYYNLVDEYYKTKKQVQDYAA